ncbi:GNAT family N-acetyltransferase [Sulfurimonas sp.]
MVRKANIDDLKILSKLLKELFTQEIEFEVDKKLQKKALAKIINSKKIGDIFVLQKKKKVIAMVTILYTYSTALGARVCLLEDMVVDKSYRQKGYGSKLLNSVVKTLNKGDVKRVTLLSDYDNKKAHKFYKKFGFKKSSMVVIRK